MRRGSRAICSALLIAGLLASACSGDEKSDSTESSLDAPTTTRATGGTTTTTTVASRPSTTVASTDPDETTDPDDTTSGGPTTTLVPTTTSVPDGPTYPLTGLPITDDTKGYRAALVVKMDNHPQARPQTGLNHADIVFEENVELLTRFAAVFQSDDSDPVGPIRSARTQDENLVASLTNPLFAWSGGNPRVTNVIRNSPYLIDVSWTVAGDKGGYRRIRSPGIDTEHTLYASTPLLFANFTPAFAPPPQPQFIYRVGGEAVDGEATDGADVAMDGVAVRWLWDAAGARYVREQAGRPHLVNGGDQVNAANVVILEVEYRRSPADPRSPEAQTLGVGKVYVLTAGVMVEGIWQRPEAQSPYLLTDLEGNVIALTPGRTWVELSRPGSTTPLPS